MKYLTQSPNCTPIYSEERTIRRKYSLSITRVIKINMTLQSFLIKFVFSFIVQVVYPHTVTINILIFFFFIFSHAYLNLCGVMCVCLCGYNFECSVFRSLT